MATLEENRQQALDWANARRSEWDMPKLDELPMGFPGSATACVLGNALNRDSEHKRLVSFGGNGFMCVSHLREGRTFKVDVTKVKLPDEVAAFEYDFERGFYNDLAFVERTRQEWYWGRASADDSPIADELNLVGFA